VEATCRQSCHVKKASVPRFDPRLLGFAVSGGAEAAASTCFLDNTQPKGLFMKIDFRNAFNTSRRDAVLEATDKHFPELPPYATSTIASSSDHLASLSFRPRKEPSKVIHSDHFSSASSSKSYLIAFQFELVYTALPG